MDRKAMARETLEIMKQGYYEPSVKNGTGQKSEKRQIVIKEAMEQSVKGSILILCSMLFWIIPKGNIASGLLP